MTGTLQTWRLELPWERPPLSLNDRTHYQQVHRKRVVVMDAVHLLAKQARLPRGLAHAGIVLWWQVNTRHRRDEDNLDPTLKACCDALSRGSRNHPGYGLVPDDDWQHVTSGRSICMVRDEPMRMWLDVTDLSGGAS